MNKVKVLRTIEQIALIVFPAVITIMGILHLADKITVAKGVFEVTLTALGAIIAIIEGIVAKDYVSKG